MGEIDVNLIQKYLNGDEQSLEILIKRYLKSVFYFVFRYFGNTQEAEDATQEVFLKMWKNIRKFDRNKNFKAWLFTIAKNSSIDRLRKKKEVSFSDFENTNGKNYFPDNIMDKTPLQNEIFDSKNFGNLFSNALVKLLPAHKAILVLRHNEDMTFREIAESQRISINTVKSRYRRALLSLREIIQ
jgi:RNA polymerase sigma-70 factor, ECF subfamily